MILDSTGKGKDILTHAPRMRGDSKDCIKLCSLQLRTYSSMRTSQRGHSCTAL